MLFDEDARRQRLGGVTRLDRDRRLHDDRAGIELGRHEMDGDAGDVDAVFERLPLRVDARKRRQQRGVNVEDRVRKRVAERPAPAAA